MESLERSTPASLAPASGLVAGHMHLFEERRKPAQTTSCLSSTHPLFSWIGSISSYWPRDRATSRSAMAAVAAAAIPRRMVPIRPSHAFGEGEKERPSGIFRPCLPDLIIRPPLAHRLVEPQSRGTNGGPNTVRHDWTPMLKRANPRDHGAKQTSLSPAANLPTAEHPLTRLIFGVWGQERDGTPNTTLPGPGQFACSLDGVHHNPSNGRIAGATPTAVSEEVPVQSCL